MRADSTWEKRAVYFRGLQLFPAECVYVLAVPKKRRMEDIKSAIYLSKSTSTYTQGCVCEGEEGREKKLVVVAILLMSFFFLPSTQSFSTSVWMLADLRPTQKVDKTSNPTKRTLPACLCTNRPRWKRCHCSFVRSHNAALLPDALPCWENNKERKKYINIYKRDEPGSTRQINT